MQTFPTQKSSAIVATRSWLDNRRRIHHWTGGGGGPVKLTQMQEFASFWLFKARLQLLRGLSVRPAEKIDIAVLGAVPQEVQKLDALLANSRVDELAGGAFRIGKLQDHTVLVGATGIGKVNAAISAAALLTSYDIDQVWNIGCAGCFEQGGLKVGDVLITAEFLCGDEGVLSAQGVQSARQIGIPLVAKEGRGYFDAFPASPLVAQVKERLPAGCYGTGGGTLLMPLDLPDSTGLHAQPEATFQLAYAPSLTVGMVSGDPEVARQRYGHHRALAENMEGSAIAQTCLRLGKAFVECRGMSNTVGERDKRHWQMEKALAHCHAVLLNWLSAATQPAV